MSGGVINISFAEQPYGVYKIQVIDSRGQVIHAEIYNLQADNAQKKIVVAGMNGGIYRLLMTDATGKKTVKTLLAK